MNVKGQVEEKLNEKILELISEAKKAIDCEKFRSELATIYESKTFPVNAPSLGQVHINLQPTDIGFSGLKI